MLGKDQAKKQSSEFTALLMDIATGKSEMRLYDQDGIVVMVKDVYVQAHVHVHGRGNPTLENAIDLYEKVQSGEYTVKPAPMTEEDFHRTVNAIRARNSELELRTKIDNLPVTIMSDSGREGGEMIGFIGDDILPHAWTKGGKYATVGIGTPHPYDLVLVKKQQPESFGWINVYKGTNHYARKQNADYAALSGRIACVQVTRGQGL